MPAAVQAYVHAINAALDNAGKTVKYVALPAARGRASREWRSNVEVLQLCLTLD